MVNHEENPVRISRIITQKSRTRDGMQWCEAYRVTWTDPANGSSLVRMVGSLADAKRLKRQIQGKPIAA
jgi:hypothetical protein